MAVVWSGEKNIPQYTVALTLYSPSRQSIQEFVFTFLNKVFREILVKLWLRVLGLWAVSSCHLYGCFFTQSNFDTAVEHLHWSCTLQGESALVRGKTSLRGNFVVLLLILTSVKQKHDSKVSQKPVCLCLTFYKQTDASHWMDHGLWENTEPTLLVFLNSFPGAQQSPPVAAQDLVSVFKAGYLEKRRKGGCSANKIHILFD